MFSSYLLHVVPVVISKRELSVDLVILHMIDYKVILGMDFFSSNMQLLVIAKLRSLEKRCLYSLVIDAVAKIYLLRL